MVIGGPAPEPVAAGHNSARLRNNVVLPLPDEPVMTMDSPRSSRRSSGSISRSPAGVRTSTRSNSTESSGLGPAGSTGSSRARSLASMSPCSRMIAAL